MKGRAPFSLFAFIFNPWPEFEYKNTFSCLYDFAFACQSSPIVYFKYSCLLPSLRTACLLVFQSGFIMTISNSPNPSFRFLAGFLSNCLLSCMLFKYSFVSVILSAYLPFPVSAVSACLPVVRIFVSFSYPVCLSSFPSVCLLACRSNIRFVQLSCLPIFPPSACLPVSVSQSACLYSSNVHIHMHIIVFLSAHL